MGNIWTEIAEMNTNYLPAKMVVNGYEMSEDNGYSFYSINISTGCTQDGYISYGCTFSPSCTVSMRDTEVIQNGSSFEVYFQIEGVWKHFGKFFVTQEPKRRNGVMDFDGEGQLSYICEKVIVPFKPDELSMMHSIKEVCERIESATGIPVIIDDMADWINDEIIYFPSSSYVDDKALKIFLNARQILGGIALVHGGNVIERNGEIHIDIHGSGSTMTQVFDEDSYTDLYISKKRYMPSPITVTYQPYEEREGLGPGGDHRIIVDYVSGNKKTIKIATADNASGEEYDSAYSLNIECDWVGYTVTNEQTYAVPRAYRPFEAQFTGYHPFLYAGAEITVNDEDGNQQLVFCDSVTYEWDGGMLIQASSSFDAQSGEGGVNQSTITSSASGTMTPEQQGAYNQIQAFKEVYVHYVEANDAKIKKIESESITAADADLKYANIDLTNIQDGTIKNAMIGNAQISFEKVDQSFINDLTVDTLFGLNLKAIIGNFGYLNAGEADLKYANIDLTNIQDGTIKNAMIGNAQISFEKVDQSFINDLTVDTLFGLNLKAIIGNFGYLNAGEADLRYANITLGNLDTANIDKANIGLLFNAVGLIDRATIVDGHVTGFLDSVEVNAGKITSGTLATDRLIIRNPDDPTKGIIYEINNITGALQAVQGDTINGEVMTPRTVNADKLIAGSVTTTELDVAQIFADNAVIQQIFAQDITATGIIRGVNLIGVHAEIEDGKIGGWAIDNTGISSKSGYSSMILRTSGELSSTYLEFDENSVAIPETYRHLNISSGDIFISCDQKYPAGNNSSIELSLKNGLELNYGTAWIKINGGIIQTYCGSIVGYSANGFVIKPNEADAGEIGSKTDYFKTMYSSKYALRDTNYGIEIGTTSSGGNSGVRIGDLSGGNSSYTYITNDCVAQHAMRVEGTLTVNSSATLGTSGGTVQIPGTLDNPVFNAIGEYVSNTYAVSIQSTNVDSYTSGASVTLPAGTYVIVAEGVFTSDKSTAIRRTAIYVGSSLNSFVSQMSQWYTRLQCTSIVKLSGTTTVSCRISAGVALSGCNTLIKAVRIK